MLNDRAIFEQPHHQALELLSAQALARRDMAAAYRFSDRRCRVPPFPEAHCFILRADALAGLGNRRAALADVTRALEITPDDLAANRRMLAWGRGQNRLNAARVLIAHDRNTTTLRDAIAVLRGGARAAFATARIQGGIACGWAAWPRHGDIEVVIGGGRGAVKSVLQPQSSHPLAGVLGKAAQFKFPLPASATMRSFTLSYGGETLVALTTDRYVSRAALPATDEAVRSRLRPIPTSSAPTVVVPVYADYEATRVCLDSVVLGTEGARVLIVNDASPDPRIVRYLEKLSTCDRLRVLTNESNLGFVGSINRALAVVTEGDVLLLNADTVVPSGFVERLGAVARSCPRIGTVTPLSNNGEFTSFPVPNAPNPLPPVEAINALDAAAARANGGTAVDLPNGIGFCLYITRACLDTVGSLAGAYHRGYLEDVDFCLRAREKGFRNVCAPSVYVGHVGSRSFATEKRSLVVRNLAVTERRFPEYRTQCAAFIALDPLRPFRQSVERAMGHACGADLLVTGEGAVAAVVEERARALLSRGGAVLILTVRRMPAGPLVRLTDPSGAAPQSLAFDMSRSRERAMLRQYLSAAAPARIEIADPANVPPVLADLLGTLGIASDILIADAGLLDHDRIPRLTSLHDPCEQADDTRAKRVVGDRQERLADARIRLNTLISDRQNRRHLLAPTPQAAIFVVSQLAPRIGKAKVVELDAPAKRTTGRSLPRRLSRRRLGIIPFRKSVQEQRLIRALASSLSRGRMAASITILGATIDDLELMRIGDTFVTGPIDPSEMERAVRAHRVDCLFLCMTSPLFGHPLQAFATHARQPVAAFDWCDGTDQADAGDLLIDRHATVEQMTEKLAGWMAGRG